MQSDFMNRTTSERLHCTKKAAPQVGNAIQNAQHNGLRSAHTYALRAPNHILSVAKLDKDRIWLEFRSTRSSERIVHLVHSTYPNNCAIFWWESKSAHLLCINPTCFASPPFLLGRTIVCSLADDIGNFKAIRKCFRHL